MTNRKHCTTAAQTKANVSDDWEVLPSCIPSGSQDLIPLQLTTERDHVTELTNLNESTKTTKGFVKKSQDVHNILHAPERTGESALRFYKEAIR